MMLQRGLAVLVSIGVIAGMVCCTPTPTPNGNENSANSNSSDNGNSNGSTNANGSNANGPFTLRVVSRRTPSANGFEVSTVRVVIFLNKGQPERDQLDGLAFDQQASDSVGGASPATLQVARGAAVTLVADELYTPSLLVNTTLDPFLAPSFTTIPAQFDRWVGAESFGVTGADKGVLHFTMDQDRTIEAVFKEANLLSVRFADDPRTSRGTGMDIDLESRPLTVPATRVGDSRGVRIVNSVVGGDQLGAFGFFNDGSTITLTIPAESPFTSWEGPVVLGRTVVVEFPDLNVPTAQRTNVVLNY
ncbi:MAG: hypothetical protein SF069_04590 [Phycisphaerae bacterium]|nr:hypothetical protein [Phycisphaerae bacterium]